MRNKVEGWVRRRLDEVSSLREHLIDAARFRRFSGAPDSAVPERLGSRALEVQLIKDYHRIEKGLALGEPKRPFGDAVARRLDRFIPAGEISSDARVREAAKHARSARAALEAWNSTGERGTTVAPGLKPWSDDIDFDADAFFASRHSVRDFDLSRAVDEEVIRSAVLHVQSTPSVCNRQAARIHLYDNPDQIREILKIQAGSAGFAERVPRLAVVTVEVSMFTGAGERNQHWIDGALAAMTLGWSFHALGLGSCMLNWSKRNVHSKRLRAVGDIPDDQSIICLLAFGHPRDSDSRRARSPRRPYESVVTNHTSN